MANRKQIGAGRSACGQCERQPTSGRGGERPGALESLARRKLWIDAGRPAQRALAVGAVTQCLESGEGDQRERYKYPQLQDAVAAKLSGSANTG